MEGKKPVYKRSFNELDHFSLGDPKKVNIQWNPFFIIHNLKEFHH